MKTISKQFYGEDTVFFVGIVRDIKDPQFRGRVRVRIFGVHNTDETILPTDHLPWASVMMPSTSASLSGVGRSPTGLYVGSSVFGIFLDGKLKQNPLVLGSLSTLNSKTDPQEYADETTSEEDTSTSDNEDEFYSFLLEKNFTSNQSSGIIGAFIDIKDGIDTEKPNTFMELESPFLDEYKLFASRRKVPLEDRNAQFSFFYNHINNKTLFGSLVSDIKNTETPQEASKLFSQRFFGREVDKSAKVISEKRPETSSKNIGKVVESEEQLFFLMKEMTRPCDMLVIHHTDTYEDMNTSAKTIDRWHRSDPFNFDEIGYHLIITRNGSIQMGRDLNREGAHASAMGANRRSIGVAIVGGRKGNASSRGLVRSSSTFTFSQWKSLDTLINNFLLLFPDGSIVGHADIDPSRRTDPDFDVLSYVKEKFNHINPTLMES